MLKALNNRLTIIAVITMTFIILLSVSVTLILMLKFATEEVDPVKNELIQVHKELMHLSETVDALETLTDKGIVHSTDGLESDLNNFNQNLSQQLTYAREMVHNKAKHIAVLEAQLDRLRHQTSSAQLSLDNLNKKLLEAPILPHPDYQDTSNKHTHAALLEAKRKMVAQNFMCPSVNNVKLHAADTMWKDAKSLMWTIEYAHHLPDSKDALFAKRVVNIENRLLCYYQFDKKDPNKLISVNLLPKPGKRVEVLGPDWHQCEREGCYECEINQAQQCTFDLVPAR